MLEYFDGKEACDGEKGVVGLDCKLLPNPWGPRFREVHNNCMLAVTVLDLDRDYELFSKLPGYSRCDHPTPGGTVVDFDVDVYEDEGTRKTRKDGYGVSLRWVSAGELAKVDVGNTVPINKAAFAYIRALPPETEIVIYWN